jgi:hypothetical protein
MRFFLLSAFIGAICELGAISVAVADEGGWIWWRVALCFWPAAVALGAFIASGVIMAWETY